METRLLISFVYWLVLTAVFLIFWPVRARTFMVHLLLFVLLCLMAMANAQFEFIEEKVASFIAYDMYASETSALTFLLQYYITYPAFYLTGDAYAAHAVNLAVQSMAFLMAMKFILKERGGTLAGLALCLFPAYFNFTIFGLRDPYVNLLTTGFVAAFMSTSTRTLVVVTIILGGLAMMARPEFAVMLIAFGLMRVYFGSSRAVRAASLAVYAVVLYVGLLFLPLAFGVASTGSISGNIQKIAEFNDLRNERRLGDEGGGSHILGGRLFSLPIVARYPIQVAATFVAPLPFEIRGGAQALAFVESLFFTAVAFLGWKRSRHTKAARFLFQCGMLYMLAISFFSINYGNLLRMRYPAHIFFVGAIAAAYDERRRRKPAPLPYTLAARGAAVEQTSQPKGPAVQPA